LVDWEQARRDSSNKGSVVESHEDDASARSLATDETKVQEDDRHQFERAKAHKSTMEAAVSEVGGLLFYCFILQSRGFLYLMMFLGNVYTFVATSYPSFLSLHY
jgi:hypothetical protein